MSGETNLNALISNMEPVLNKGEYVFTTLKDINHIPREITICEVKEPEGITLVLSKENADRYGLTYQYTAAWITLNIHSSLEAVGLTAAFSNELGNNNISCNVIAGYYHDHIFVDVKDKEKAMTTLLAMTNQKT
ncbi:ACT domain-containing protein [Tenacibaculum xiamenense]|uniref:ACT domain-containing protein n=1 Tax=Tenacibaculum xiamenense TaxID=1261553 RepID=UPI0038933C33